MVFAMLRSKDVEMVDTMNVDQSEINKFGALANQWWCENGAFKTLHQVNPLRCDFIRSIVNIDDKKLLDVGCGGGILSEALAQAGALVKGIDMAEDSIEVATLHALDTQVTIEYAVTTIENEAQQRSEHYDLITCMEMLEHVPSPESVIAACAQSVKTDGTVFFSTLNRNLKSYLLAIIGAEHILNMVPKGTHQYHKFIQPYELVRTAQKYGLAPIKMMGIHYNPLNKQFSLTDNCDVNYMIAFRKIAS